MTRLTKSDAVRVVLSALEERGYDLMRAHAQSTTLMRVTGSCDQAKQGGVMDVDFEAFVNAQGEVVKLITELDKT